MASDADLSADHGQASADTGTLSVRFDEFTLSFRKWLAALAVIVCISLYVLFGVFACGIWHDRDLLEHVLENPEAGVIGGALLAVPSALLWGLMRAAFRHSVPDSCAKDLSDTIKSVHPVIDNSIGG